MSKTIGASPLGFPRIFDDIQQLKNVVQDLYPKSIAGLSEVHTLEAEHFRKLILKMSGWNSNGRSDGSKVRQKTGRGV